MQILGHISPDGKLLSPNSPALTAWFKKNAGKPVKLTVVVNGKKRSNPQNAYYWGVVVDKIMAALIDLGHELTEETTHELLKAKFNAVEIVNKNGVTDEIAGSTAILNTAEFEAYMDRIRVWASQFLQLYIELPNEQSAIDYTLIAHHDNQVGATIVKQA